MGFLDKFQQTVTSGFNSTVDKAKGASEQMSLNNTIRELNEQINNLYGVIGHQFYNDQKAGSRSDYRQWIQQIDDLYAQIRETQKRIQDIKDMVTCPICGKKMVAGTRFCTNCGADLGRVGVAPASSAAAPEPSAPQYSPAPSFQNPSPASSVQVPAFESAVAPGPVTDEPYEGQPVAAAAPVAEPAAPSQDTIADGTAVQSEWSGEPNVSVPVEPAALDSEAEIVEETGSETAAQSAGTTSVPMDVPVGAVEPADAVTADPADPVRMTAGFCTSCGKPLTPGARFCVYCGTPVQND